jgi:hypothetical protein
MRQIHLSNLTKHILRRAVQLCLHVSGATQEFYRRSVEQSGHVPDGAELKLALFVVSVLADDGFMHD